MKVKVKFTTPLITQSLDEYVHGRRYWVLQHDFRAIIDTEDGAPPLFTNHCLLTVPAGFKTDFASVPRLPLSFLLTGDFGHKAAVVHDYLYSLKVKRRWVDAVFEAGLRAEEVPWWRRKLMWGAVRSFGWVFYRDKKDESEPNENMVD